MKRRRCRAAVLAAIQGHVVAMPAGELSPVLWSVYDLDAIAHGRAMSRVRRWMWGACAVAGLLALAQVLL